MYVGYLNIFPILNYQPKDSRVSVLDRTQHVL